MKKDSKAYRRSEDGIALLIAIFVLLLISVVAIALLVSSGTETALGANYRSSSTVYYAALAGLEETRGRLLPKNPNSLVPSSIPPNTQFPVGQVVYVLNRLPGETIAPWDTSNLYYDNEYQTEFNQAASSASWGTAYSVWDSNVQGIPGPLFKWVRITAATEQSLYLDVDSDGAYDHTIPIYYNPAQVDSHGNPAPSLIKALVPPPSAVQVLQVTAMAYSPNGSKKLLQYLVAPIALNLGVFPAALTLDGNNVGNNAGILAPYPLSVPNWAGFYVNGNDQYSPNSCVPGSNPVAGVGYTNNSDNSNSKIIAAIPPGNHGNYLGSGPADPNVNYIGTSISPTFQSVAQLDSLVTTITENADVSATGPATQSAMPAAMSATNPMTIVVNGDLTLSGWHGTGYGLLLVTGTFTYDPDATWNGIVLVIGKGIMYSHQAGTGQFSGAVLIASTVDTSGNPLPAYTAGLPTPLGSPSFSFTSSAGSQGIYYSSCWIQYAQPALKYQVLSFHEIPQN